MSATLSDNVKTIQGTIAILTFRRPDDLRVILPAVFEQIEQSGANFDVLVVDNDPKASATAVLEEHARAGLRWVVEPQPGIAAARNRALTESATRDVLVFIDDDETPHPNWLGLLLAQWESTGASAVVGAVVSEFDGELDPWITASAIFQRPRFATGTVVGTAATNNLLLDLADVRRLNLRFDVDFGLSGGSDTLFTRALVAGGGFMVWCDEAVVTDRVPTQRMTRGWVIRRSLRMGNSSSRASLALTRAFGDRTRLRASLAYQGLIRLVLGSVRAGVGTVIRSQQHQARGARTASKGAGVFLGAFGYVYSEYRRPAAD